MSRSRPLRTLVQVTWETAPAATLTLAVLTLATALLPVAFLWVSGRLVGQVPAAIAQGLDSAAGNRLLEWLFLAAGVFILQQVAGPVSDLVGRTMARRVDRRIRTRTMRAMAGPAGIAHLEDPALQDLVLVARGLSKGEMTCGLAVMGLAGVISTILSGLGSAVIVVAWEPWVGAMLVAAWIAVREYFRRDLGRIAIVMQGNARGLRRSLYYRDIVMQPGVAKELRIFGLRDLIVARFDVHWISAMREVWRERRRAMWPMFLSAGVLVVVHAVAVIAIGRAFEAGQIELGSLVVLLSASLGVGAMGNVSNHDFWLANGLPAIAALVEGEREILAHPRAIPEGGRPIAPTMPERTLRFEDISFAYPGNPTPVYQGLSLEIPVGRSLAIVGANGAGKTTLAKLLARFYDPTSGKIEVDGVDLRSLDARAWQQQIAAIFQDFVQYPLSAAENLAFGGLSIADDRERLERAARQAGALEVIEGLSDGWETPMSRQFAGGADLSGGQWQRLALARAMVAVEAGARVLILDEPTANLDVRAEAALFDRFLDLTSGLTTILISHRFSTVRRADQICVLDEGRVAELGTHEALLALDGRYARMFRLQAARFAEGAVAE